jgi:hypothetical protein
MKKKKEHFRPAIRQRFAISPTSPIPQVSAANLRDFRAPHKKIPACR